MATLKDVAKLAGVSVSTASRALSGTGRISQATIQQVLQAADDLSYTVNIHARSLKMGRSHTIALMVPDIRNPIFPLIAKAAERTARDHGYNVYLCNSDESTEVEKAYIQSLCQHNIDGIIIASTSRTEDIVELLDASGIPYVSLIRELPSTASSVTVDNAQCGILSAEHLVNQGCRNIILLRPISDLALYQQRHDACTDYLSQHHVTHQTLSIDVDAPDWSKLDALESIDGLIAMNDPLAMMALGHLYQRNLRVPDDIHVIGMDGLPAGQYTSPPLTSVAQPLEAIGEAAVRLLLQHIEGHQDTTQQKLAVQLLQRISS